MSRSSTYRPKFGFDIRINSEKPKTGRRAPEAATQRCGRKGCAEPAMSRVPKSRNNLEDRVWLCSSHLREHNEKWNFFEGMSDEEVERYCVEALVGHRPTWPLGERSAAKGKAPGERRYWSYGYEDGFAFFEDAAKPAPKKQSTLTKGQLDALEALGLEEGATLSQIKAKYKELVKRFHPDTNGGDRSKEERLKQVIKAYGLLRATGVARGTA